MTDRTELPDGIYFDLSFEDYLAEPRVSSGDLTHMIEGPAAYWAQSPLNPDREEREETEAMKLGRAYHCARLEPHKFDELYVREFDLEDMPEGSLLSDKAYKEWLKNMGEAQTKAGETVLERAARIGSLGGPMTWHEQRYLWEGEHDDLTWIGRKQWAEIKRDAARIRMNPELAGLLEGGFPEVSILWTDEATGLKLKCRPDYLGSDWITHLKTWDMKTFGKPGNRAVRDAFMYNGHYRTAWFYSEGLSAMAVQELDLRNPDGSLVSEPDHYGLEARKEWLKPKRWDHFMLYVRRQGIPDIRAREIMFFDLPPGVTEQEIGAEDHKFSRSVTALGRKAHREVHACLQQIAECSELYGTKGEPWFPRDMMGKLEDDDFSDFWLDSMDEPR